MAKRRTYAVVARFGPVRIKPPGSDFQAPTRVQVVGSPGRMQPSSEPGHVWAKQGYKSPVREGVVGVNASFTGPQLCTSLVGLWPLTARRVAELAGAHAMRNRRRCACASYTMIASTYKNTARGLTEPPPPRVSLARRCSHSSDGNRSFVSSEGGRVPMLVGMRRSQWICLVR